MNNYEANYFDHWLAMLMTIQAKWDADAVVSQVKMYTDMEGLDGYDNLVREIAQIKANNDLPAFVTIAQNYGMSDINLEDLEAMTDYMLHLKV